MMYTLQACETGGATFVAQWVPTLWWTNFWHSTQTCATSSIRPLGGHGTARVWWSWIRANRWWVVGCGGLPVFLIEIQSGPGFWNQMSPHKSAFQCSCCTTAAWPDCCGFCAPCTGADLGIMTIRLFLHGKMWWTYGNLPTRNQHLWESQRGWCPRAKSWSSIP